MICVVPPYDGPENQDAIHVSLFVKNSDGKTSESHSFVYTRGRGCCSSTSLTTGGNCVGGGSRGKRLMIFSLAILSTLCSLLLFVLLSSKCSQCSKYTSGQALQLRDFIKILSELDHS